MTTDSDETGREALAEDWKRQIINAGGDENVAQQAVTLASLNGLFDYLATAPVAQEPVATFQDRVRPWMMTTFGPEISADTLERGDRFIEEALELVQAQGYAKERAHALVDYVYGRPQGDINQEVGGVMVTLAALCLAAGTDMHSAGETELARVWTKVDQIRAKQAAKPRGSALPIAMPPATRGGRGGRGDRAGPG